MEICVSKILNQVSICKGNIACMQLSPTFSRGLSGRGHISGVPMSVLLLFLLLFSGQLECNIPCLDLFLTSLDSDG